MTRPAERGTHRRSCRTCGWSGTYDTAARGDYAKRRHSCERHLRLAARKANGEAIRARHALIDRTPKPCLHQETTHVHGTYACWTLDKCRCWDCTAAQRAYEQQRVRNNAYGRSNYIDAQPTRDHVKYLMDHGMGLKRIAKAAGVGSGTLSKLIYGVYRATGTGGGRNGVGELVRGPSRRALRTTAEKILTVELDLADGARVDATGTTRRIRALVALGWSQSKLAALLDITRSNFHLASGTHPTVLASTARRVAEVYDELSMTLPPQESGHDRAAAVRARAYAKRRGWLPPLALDDDRLDDPTYKAGSLISDTTTNGLDETAIYRRTHGDKTVRLTKGEAAELVRRWTNSGRSLAECQRVTGLNPHRFLRDQQEAS